MVAAEPLRRSHIGYTDDLGFAQLGGQDRRIRLYAAFRVDVAGQAATYQSGTDHPLLPGR